MSRPANSYLTLIQENARGHRTKAEIEQRKKGEEALLTKVKMREFPETKENPKAHLEYKRVSNLMKKIEKDDDLFSAVINRYCMLKAECDEIKERSETLYGTIQQLQRQWESGESELKEEQYFSLQAKLTAQYLAAEKSLSPKRKMLFDIEKENLMTIAGSIRCVPKQVIKDDDDDDDLYN